MSNSSTVFRILQDPIRKGFHGSEFIYLFKEGDHRKCEHLAQNINAGTSGGEGIGEFSRWPERE